MVINIVTLGCSKNLVDSEKIMGALRECGNTVIHDGKVSSAPVVIINTCGFIADAKEESIDTIMDFIAAKERGDIERLYITGCLSERYKKELEVEIPEADQIFRLNETGHLIAAINGKEAYRNYTGSRFITGPGHYAYLKVSEGCSHGCSFCAIPMIRGRQISVAPDELKREALMLAGSGVSELILVAQDLTSYGSDIGEGESIVSLASSIAGMDLFSMIRLHYMFPSTFPVAILDVIRDNPSICNYIDIPLQHISDRMLKIMNRGTGEIETRRLLDRIRTVLPDAAIRTTFIAGHPGETDDDYRKLRSFISEFRFERMGLFSYSHEEGTPSWRRYSDDIPREIKEARVSELMEMQQDISEENNSRLEGSLLTVIIDGKEGDLYTGRTEYDSPGIDQEVFIETDEHLEPGSLREVRITGHGPFELFGDLTSGQ